MPWWGNDILANETAECALDTLSQFARTRALYPLRLDFREAIEVRRRLENTRESALRDENLGHGRALIAVSAAYMASGSRMSEDFRWKAIEACADEAQLLGPDEKLRCQALRQHAKRIVAHHHCVRQVIDHLTRDEARRLEQVFDRPLRPEPG